MGGLEISQASENLVTVWPVNPEQFVGKVPFRSIALAKLIKPGSGECEFGIQDGDGWDDPLALFQRLSPII